MFEKKCKIIIVVFYILLYFSLYLYSRYGISGRVVCIVCNEYSPAAVTARDELNSFLKAEGVYIIDEEAEHNSADNINNADKSADEASRAPDDDEGVVKLEDVDLLICLGGDGTLLKVNPPPTVNILKYQYCLCNVKETNVYKQFLDHS